MNTDDFEKRLEHQPLRPPPLEWRGEILAAARAAIRPARPPGESGLRSGWRFLLARVPQAWGAVAALWLVIIGVNSLLSGPMVAVESRAPAPGDPFAAWSLRQMQMSLLAEELADPSAPALFTPPAAPGPRSDRRREQGLGGLEQGDAPARTVERAKPQPRFLRT